MNELIQKCQIKNLSMIDVLGLKFWRNVHTLIKSLYPTSWKYMLIKNDLNLIKNETNYDGRNKD